MKYDPKSSHAEEFISHEEIEETLAYGEANRANRACRRYRTYWRYRRHGTYRSYRSHRRFFNRKKGSQKTLNSIKLPQNRNHLYY